MHNAHLYCKAGQAGLYGGLEQQLEQLRSGFAHVTKHSALCQHLMVCLGQLLLACASWQVQGLQVQLLHKCSSLGSKVKDVTSASEEEKLQGKFRCGEGYRAREREETEQG
eukprot:695534-Pelagomonas_calceolata.AAC.2